MIQPDTPVKTRQRRRSGESRGLQPAKKHLLSAYAGMTKKAERGLSTEGSCLIIAWPERDKPGK
jgi:hypothetical protein